MFGDQITLNNITVVYNDKKEIFAVRDLSFSIAPGEFVCLIGPSGCGKSTTLHVIAGFIKPNSGQAFINKSPIKKPGIERAIVFQDQNLFFWRTVIGNVEFGPEIVNINNRARAELVHKYLKMTGLVGFEERYPSQLSGGEKQRVAIARALAPEPTTLLLDEPFRSIDAQTKIAMQELLLDIWEKKKRTVLFVTHDLDEAIFLADRVLVMTQRPGSIKTEIAIPFERPRSYQMLLSSEFLNIKEQIMELLKTEIGRTL